MEFTQGKIDGVVVSRLVRNVDDRGYLMETFRVDSLPEGLRPVMGYISVTEPGIARGPHEHRVQTDILTFPGPGTFRIVLWDNREKGLTRGILMILFGGLEDPFAVVVPPGVVHAYRNISRTERGTVLNYPDALYAGWGRREPLDEIRHEVVGDPFFEDFLRA
jgi:dTDP-4-dehydrorhamnose 3,5-epimerase